MSRENPVPDDLDSLCFTNPAEFHAWLDRLAKEVGGLSFRRGAEVSWEIDGDCCKVCPVHFIARHGCSFIDWTAEAVARKSAAQVSQAIRRALAISRVLDIAPQPTTRGWKKRLERNLLVSVWEQDGELVFNPVVRAWRNRRKKSLLGKPAEDRLSVATDAGDHAVFEAIQWAIDIARDRDLELF